MDHETKRFSRVFFADTLVTSEFTSFPNSFKLITQCSRIQLLFLNCTRMTSVTSFYQLRGNRVHGFGGRDYAKGVQRPMVLTSEIQAVPGSPRVSGVLVLQLIEWWAIALATPVLLTLCHSLSVS